MRRFNSNQKNALRQAADRYFNDCADDQFDDIVHFERRRRPVRELVD